jgi:hypothetical protein
MILSGKKEFKTVILSVLMRMEVARSGKVLKVTMK